MRPVHITPTSDVVKALGLGAGFSLVRIGPATEMHVERARYLAWISEGRQGKMRWIDADHALRASSPQSALSGARSVISVALAYWTAQRPALNGNVGRIARYAWGDDYHQTLGAKLSVYAASLSEQFGGHHRWYVDTGPIMDKALAARSGLGWYGKNTNILTESFGSFVLLGEIITTMELAHDAPLNRSCGSCRLCVAACPTRALGPAYTIDSRKCISYLTIEHRGPIARDLRPLMGDWVFGCDICQDVCPPSVEPHLSGSEDRRLWLREVREYMQHRRPSNPSLPAGAATKPETDANHPAADGRVRANVDLLWLLRLNHAGYLDAFRNSAMRRAKVWMLRRNAAIALGNVGGRDSIEPLLTALCGDEHPVVRGHAAWALGRVAQRLAYSGARQDLLAALEAETEESVCEEIRLTLAELGPAH